jgi:hypothetical protein
VDENVKSHDQTSYESSDSGVRGTIEGPEKPLGYVGPWNLDKLSRSDMAHIERAIANPKTFGIPPELMTALAPTLGRILVSSRSDRDKMIASRVLINLASHDLEVAKYWATITRENAANDVPVSAPNSPALPAPAESPSERRKTLLDPSESMRLIHQDPKVAELWDAINAKESLERAKAANNG